MVDNIIVLIPAYNPNDNLCKLVDELTNNFRYILIVNDGSKVSCNDVFDECLKKNNVYVYNHMINLGKGRAIKSGINYALNKFSDGIVNNSIKGFVTVDADGQHRVNDIVNCASTLLENEDCLILGARSFDKKIPFRSKFGNSITCFVMRLLFGVSLNDTQTGLRAFSISNAMKFLSINGERYEYEMTMLIEANKKGISLFEVPIETIYINGNEESHFNPIVDSYRIYSIIFKDFFKFSFSGIFSFCIDVFFFSIFINFFKNISDYYIIISAIFARIISSIVNFSLNKLFVFNNTEDFKKTILKYYALAVIVLFLSSTSTHILHMFFGGKEVIIKVLVDICLFFIDFRVQRIIFKQK